MTSDLELERQLRAMRPCPKCGVQVHPENTGFHVCTLTSNPRNAHELLAICHCIEYYGSHHPECPAQQQLNRLRAALEQSADDTLHPAERRRIVSEALTGTSLGRGADETADEQVMTGPDFTSGELK